MRILMLGNSLTAANNLPEILARLTGAEVVAHTRNGARLAEHLHPNTSLGARTLGALKNESWDYVVLQESSAGPLKDGRKFLDTADGLCAKIRANGAKPVFFATWAFQRNSKKLKDMKMNYNVMADLLYRAYHEAARRNNALVADAGRKFQGQFAAANLYAPDGCHPSETGSRLAAEAIASVILADCSAPMEETGTLSEVSTAKVSDPHLRIVYIWRLLEEYTDEQHTLTTMDLQRLLEENYGIHVHRTTLPKDIELLRAGGVDVGAIRRQRMHYYLAGRKFSTAQLRQLLTLVATSDWVSEAERSLLTDKLLTLASRPAAEELRKEL